MLGFALRRVDRPADAADVVAETFAVAWRRIDELPTGRATRPWLFEVARRVMANQHRGRRRHRRLAQRLRDELDRQTPRTAATTAADALVHEALDRLAPHDREILRLSSWERLDPSEIALVLGITATAARSRLHRARQRLRGHLTGSGSPAPSVLPVIGPRPGQELQ